MERFGENERCGSIEVYSSLGGMNRLDIDSCAENVIGLKKNGVEVVVPEKEPGYIGRIKLERGHLMWEFDVVSRELVLARYEEVELEIGSGRIVRKLVEREGCMYFGSLNRKNAIKYLVRLNDKMVKKGLPDQR